MLSSGNIAMASTVNGRCWRAAISDTRKLSKGSVKNFRRRSRSVTVKKIVPPGAKERKYCGMILV
jgi:hypothetical protein